MFPLYKIQREHLHENLVKISFKRLETDSSVYCLSGSDECIVHNLAICTRGDLLYSVHLLTRRMSNPRVLDLQKAKRVLVYLMHTAQSGVTFHGNNVDQIVGKADSAFNSGEGERKNCYGNCFQ